MNRVRGLVLGVVVLAACKGSDPVPQTDTAVADAGREAGVAPVCTANAYTVSRPVFRENALGWNLATALSDRTLAVDWNGDDWTDLVIVRANATNGAPWAHFWRNTGNNTFEDVTDATGFLRARSGSGNRQVQVVAFGDVDNDGDLDAFSGTSSSLGGTETSEILFNQGDGTFALGPAENELRMNGGGASDPSGASFVDVDRDGDVDLWVVHNNGGVSPRQARLFLNDGSGRFVDGTAQLGLTTRSWTLLSDVNAGLAHLRSAWSGTACDLNNDGNPELLGASYGRAPNQLFQATRTGNTVRYNNRSIESGYAFDGNQRWQDDSGAMCFCNFTDPEAEGCDSAMQLPASAAASCRSYLQQIPWDHNNDTQAFRLGGNSGSTICNDIDNDGDIDLLTNEIRHARVGQGSDMAEILVNQGGADVLFARPGRASMRLTVPHADPDEWDEGIITSILLDFDNDGWTDVLFANGQYPDTRALLYHQDGPLCFTQLPTRADTIDLNRAGHGAAADFDRDGDMDLIVGHIRNRCSGSGDTAPCYATGNPRLYENQLSGNYVQFRLEGVTANRAAIGAVVRVTASGVTQTRVVSGGWGHYGEQGDLLVHAGLGSATSADVAIVWPNAERTQQMFTVAANHRYFVREGGAPVLRDRPILVDAGVDAGTDVGVDAETGDAETGDAETGDAETHDAAADAFSDVDHASDVATDVATDVSAPDASQLDSQATDDQ